MQRGFICIESAAQCSETALGKLGVGGGCLKRLKRQSTELKQRAIHSLKIFKHWLKWICTPQSSERERGLDGDERERALQMMLIKSRTLLEYESSEKLSDWVESVDQHQLVCIVPENNIQPRGRRPVTVFLLVYWLDPPSIRFTSDISLFVR